MDHNGAIDPSSGSTSSARGPAYGRVARTLHWLVAAALAAQFTLGYVLDVGGGRGRGRGRGGDSGRGRGRGGDELVVFGDDGMLTAHVVLGLTILVLAGVRLYWRRRTGLPPWAETLTARERTSAHWTERALYGSLFVMPLTGLWLLLVSDDALALHVASHIALFVALAAHLALVLKHQWIDRDGLLRRMLW